MKRKCKHVSVRRWRSALDWRYTCRACGKTFVTKPKGARLTARPKPPVQHLESELRMRFDQFSAETPRAMGNTIIAERVLGASRLDIMFTLLNEYKHLLNQQGRDAQEETNT